MIALLAANPYLGIKETNWDHIYQLVYFILALAVVLLILRGMGKIRERASQKKNAWDTFYKLSKARGLSRAQTDTLAIVARKSRIASPARLLGSIQLFDRAVDKTSAQIEFDDRQNILLESMRKKLATAKELWNDSDGDRRQLARARCSWNARVGLIQREEIEKEVMRNGVDGDEHIVTAAINLEEREEVAKYSVQISDISAGGVAFLASPSFSGSSGDIIIIGGESQRIPFTIDRVCAQLRSIEEDKERGLNILHANFLPIDQDLRRDIIHYVYKKTDPSKKRTPKGTPTPPPKGASRQL
jgi:hypothetical protein